MVDKLVRVLSPVFGTDSVQSAGYSAIEQFYVNYVALEREYIAIR